MSAFNELLGYFALGLGASAYGTLIGAGGGFIIVPALILLFGFTGANASGTSLAVVSVNGMVATFSYGRQGRIDFRTGLMLAAATVPGAIIGAFIAADLPQRTFQLIFGVLMCAIALFILLRPPRREKPLPPGAATRLPWLLHRRFVDARGQAFEYAFNPTAALACCFVIGFLSSMLGIGGGIILTPTLILLFAFPPHVATATSQIVLLVSSLFGALSHFTLGHVQFEAAIPMAVGVIIGCQIGAAIAFRVHSAWLVKALAAGMLLVGVRLAIG